MITYHSQLLQSCMCASYKLNRDDYIVHVRREVLGAVTSVHEIGENRPRPCEDEFVTSTPSKTRAGTLYTTKISFHKPN